MFQDMRTALSKGLAQPGSGRGWGDLPSAPCWTFPGAVGSQTFLCLQYPPLPLTPKTLFILLGSASTARKIDESFLYPLAALLGEALVGACPFHNSTQLVGFVCVF